MKNRANAEGSRPNAKGRRVFFRGLLHPAFGFAFDGVGERDAAKPFGTCGEGPRKTRKGE